MFARTAVAACYRRPTTHALPETAQAPRSEQAFLRECVAKRSPVNRAKPMLFDSLDMRRACVSFVRSEIVLRILPSILAHKRIAFDLRHNGGGSDGKVLDMAQHQILPVITLTIVSVGSLMRYTRTNMLEVLNADYIRTARAKGVPEKKVVYHHAFRNTLIPIITILGSTLPNLFGGAMITETLFQIPGIGYTSYQALTQGDIPFTMFYMVFLAFLTLTGNLIADILYAVADPRVRVN